MEAFDTGFLNPRTSVIQGTYDVWHANNVTRHLKVDASKLANGRCDIVNEEKPTKMEL